jgi:ligand-binding SRPBCC domain-containing protein
MGNAINQMRPGGQSRVSIARSPAGRGYRLAASQFLPYPREQIFEFFSDAMNLQTLTPAWLRFTILTPWPIHIAPGALIDYRLRVRGVPIRWQSSISVWEPPFRFVDEETRGPYKRWHHEHVFEEVDGGTLCHDTVDYEVYGGGLVDSLFVRPDLLKIFAFRQQKLIELFPRTETALSRLAAS